MRGWAMMLVRVMRFCSLGSIMAKTRVPIMGGYRCCSSNLESLRLFSLKRIQDSLQQLEEGLPDITSRQVIPSANTSSLSYIGGLQRTNPWRIFSIWAGLMKPTSPSSTFQQAVMPPFTKQLSTRRHSLRRRQIIRGEMSPCLHLRPSRNCRAEQTAQIMRSIYSCASGQEARRSSRRQSQASYSMATWLQFSQKTFGFGYYSCCRVSTEQRQGNLKLALSLTISLRLCSYSALMRSTKRSFPSFCAATRCPSRLLPMIQIYQQHTHSSTTMQLTSSPSFPAARRASSTSFRATSSRPLSSFIARRTAKHSSEGFRQSKRPSEPRMMKSSSQVRLSVRISAQDITPNLRAALSPNARDSARPGPQLHLPGAQMRLGPENLSFPIYSGRMTPPQSSMRCRSTGWSGLCGVVMSVMVSPRQRRARESPTLTVKRVFSEMTTATRVQPEKAMSMPKRSSYSYTFFSACLIPPPSTLLSATASCSISE